MRILIIFFLNLYCIFSSFAQNIHLFNFSIGHNVYTSGDIGALSLKPSYEYHFAKRFHLGVGFDLSFGNEYSGLYLSDETRKHTIVFNSKREADNFWQTYYSSGDPKTGIKLLDEKTTYLGTKTFSINGGYKLIKKKKSELIFQTGVDLSWISKSLIVSTEAGEYLSLLTGELSNVQLVVNYVERYIDLGQNFNISYRYQLNSRIALGAILSVDYYYITKDWNRAQYLSLITKL